jgi:EmrB/QacA subfamily drug resistance transporter
VTPTPIALAPTSHPRRWAILAVLNLSLLLVVIDNLIVNVTLPTLVKVLHASNSELQWIVDSYTLAFAGLLLTAGSITDRYGRKPALMAGLGVFGLASAAAAVSHGATSLITWRAVMGLAAAFVMPPTLSIITNVFRESKERAAAIGIWSATAGVGIALGPIAGGFLLKHFFWGSVFLVNVPLVVATLIAVALVVPNSKDPSAGRLDLGGVGLSIAGLATLVWTLIEAPDNGWTSTTSLVGFALAAVLLWAFVAHERRSSEPMLDVSFFANRRFSAGSAALTMTSFALFGFTFMATQYLQFVLGYDTLAAGIRVVPFALGVILAAPLSPKFVQRFGTKAVAAGGLLVFAAGFFVLATVDIHSTYTHSLWGILLGGLGMGLTTAPCTEAVMGSLPAEKAGVGSAINDTARELGGTLGVAVTGSVYSSIYRSKLIASLAGTPFPPEAVAASRRSIGAAMQVAADPRVPAQGRTVLVQAARQSFISGMTRGVLVSAGVAIVAAAMVLRSLPAGVGDQAVTRSPEDFDPVSILAMAD